MYAYHQHNGANKNRQNLPALARTKVQYPWIL